VKNFNLLSISVFLIFLFQGCTTVNSTKNLENFKKYKDGQDIKIFCQEYALENQAEQQCMNNLSIYIRSKVECQKSVDDSLCFKRHQNNWDYSVMKTQSAMSFLLKKENPTLLRDIVNKAMESSIKDFNLTCMNSSKLLVPCRDMEESIKVKN